MPGFAGSRRTLLIGGAAVLAGAALFIGGGALGASLADDKDEPAPVTSAPGSSGVSRPAIATGLQAAEMDASNAQSGGSAGRMGMGVDSKIAPAYACAGTIDGAVAGGTIDPAALGLELRLLGGDFVLQSISVRSEGECDANGQPIDPRPVVDSSWQHVPSGYTVWVTQRSSDEPVANVNYGTSANVYSGGYAFSVGAGGPAVPLAEDAVGGDVAVARERSAIMPTWDDEQARAVVEAAVAQLAPDVTATCFYTQQTLGWDGLASLGLGDPRQAIPADLAEQYVAVSVWQQPSEDCGNTAAPSAGGSLSASFGNNVDTWLGINAYATGEVAVDYPAGGDDYSLSWSNGVYQIDISGGNATGGLGYDTLAAIARALDPSFDGACILRYGELDDATLAEYGISTPAVPDGYTIQSQTSRGPISGSDCAETSGDVSASWELTDGAGQHISATAWAYSGVMPDEPGMTGIISDQYISWQSTEGIQFSISAWSESGSAGPGRNVLVAVAQSLDPSLDVSTLPEVDSGAGAGEVKPMPAPGR